MSLPVSFRPRARRDLLDEMIHLEEEAGQEIALRYYDAVWAACQLLAGQPLAGKHFPSAVPRLAELRCFPAGRPFQKHLIFYQLAPDGIDIFRVVHGARDIDAVLADATHG
ncbi:MAG: type II toxin-antitoxin system RelE/ParE family toxin [Acidobacteria bacterium]|nr:type II toxin-antitoxin system RelE/ParE family toxin [Acidobacteriota bacterium]